MLAALDEAQTTGARLHAACRVIGISARTIERWRGQPGGDDRRCGPRRRPRNALTAVEEAHLLAIMTSARYGHLPPKQLVPRLADEGTYIASESTMYRLQKRVGLGAHRRPVLRTHVTRGATVHQATRSNQLWSWDITYLPAAIRGRFLRLYLVLDVWSRRIVGWEVHEHEVATHAATLIQRICAESGVDRKGWCCTRTMGSRCGAVRWSPRCSGSASSPPSADRTSVTTTRTPRRCSGRSSTRPRTRACPSLTVRPRIAGSLVS